MDGGARHYVTEPRVSAEFLVSPPPSKRKRSVRRRSRREPVRPALRRVLSPQFQVDSSAAAESNWTRPPWMSAQDERDLDAVLMRGTYYDRLRVHMVQKGAGSFGMRLPVPKSSLMAARDVMFIRDLMTDLGIVLTTCRIQSDSKSAVDMSLDPVAFKRTKHILRAAEFLRDLVAREVVTWGERPFTAKSHSQTFFLGQANGTGRAVW